MPGLSNCLLTAMGPLPRALATRLEPVALPLRTVLFEPHRTPRFVHFLTSGIASVVVTTAPGPGVEVAIAGREGLPEYAHLLGPEAGPSRGFIQVEGTALRMSFHEFQQEFTRHPGVLKELLRYAQHESFVSMQLCACARLHEVEARMARWLLMAADRLETTEMYLTQELMAEVIGTRRSSVTLAAGSLQRSGLLDYSRGHIRIRDREGLEAAACECYGVVRRLYRTLTGL